MYNVLNITYGNIFYHCINQISCRYVLIRVIPKQTIKEFLPAPEKVLPWGSSWKGSRWLLSAPNWCSFLQAFRDTSCFAELELQLIGPIIFWNAALGGKVNEHSYEPSFSYNSKNGFGMKYLKTILHIRKKIIT